MHVTRPNDERFDEALDVLRASDEAVYGDTDWTAEGLRDEWDGLDRERDAWLSHMREAVDSLGLTPEQHATLWGYIDMAAQSMQNRFDDDAPGTLAP